MDERNKALIVVILLIAEIPAKGQILDVCATCHDDANCNDKADGSGKVCNCRYGFVGNGRTHCLDKNECQIGAGKICGQHTTCHNTHGSYYCTCLAGYSPSNNMAVFIPNDGTYCQDNDECTTTGVCGAGAQCRNLEGSFDCSCQPGYQVHNGVEPFQPHRDQASCKVVDCGLPASVKDTVLLSLTGTTYRSVALYVCDEGFVWRSGDNSSVCGADGLWKRSNLVCEEVVCGSPPVIESTEQVWDSHSTPGSTVLYVCKEGFSNEGGLNISMCNENGQWTPPTLSCQDKDECTTTGVCGAGAQCRNLEGSFDCSCQPGYQVHNGVEPFQPHRDQASCKVVDCGQPASVEDTVLLSVTGTTYRSVALYVCDEGFVWRSGDNSSVCGADGLWKRSNLVCEEVVCGSPPVIESTEQVWDSHSTPGSTVLYVCKEGFSNEGGLNISMCNENGQWTPPTLSCQDNDECTTTGVCGAGAQCRNLEGSFDCSCQPGYQVHNGVEPFQPHRDQASCKVVDCGQPASVEDTVLLSVTGTTYRSVALYVCDEGFVWRSGDNSSVCGADGLWKRSNLVCKEVVCGSPPVIESTEQVWDSHSTPGSTVLYVCKEGFSNEGGLNISMCNESGQWTPPTLSCQDKDECTTTGVCGAGAQCRNLEGSFDCSCQPGYQVHNGVEPFQPHRDQASCKVVDCGQPASVEDTVLLSLTGTTYRSVAMFACDEGFVWRSGDNSSVCGADGLWKRSNLVCEEVVCGSPPVIESTEQVWDSHSTPGSTVLYVCKEGFSNEGGLNISMCNESGQWTPPTLSCQDILCGDPTILPHTGQVWNGSSSPGSTVAYYCKTGFYHSEGNNMSLCSINGYWTKPNILCKEVDCGVPPSIPHSTGLWDKISTLGSHVVYQCNSGYRRVGEGNVSVCTASGDWVGASLLCLEINCYEAVSKPHAKVLWDGTSHIGSVAYYECEEGYYSRSLRNYSVCEENGLWEDINFWCEEISCGFPLTLPNTNVRWDGTSEPGSVVLYECTDGFYQISGNDISTCSLAGQWGEVSIKCKAKCGPIPSLAKSEVMWHNSSVVIHRCLDGYHSRRGSNTSVCGSFGVWQRATLRCIEIQSPVNHLSVLNETCLHWRAEKYEEDKEEVYKVTYIGFRDYERSFHDSGQRNVTSKADQLELCLNLLPVTNYTISVTALSSRFTASISTNTSLTVPPAPVVYYKEFETPVPTLSLRRSPNTLDPISFYQVFVLPLEGIITFNCSSPASSNISSRIKSSTEYITAQIDVRHVWTEMDFTVGDGLYYGGFFNAPLENGRSYNIILRAVSQWKSDLKSACVVWAKVRGTAYVLMVSGLSAAASIGLVAMFLLVGYFLIWFFKRT